MLWCNRVARFNNVCKSLLPKTHNSSIWKPIYFYMYSRWSLNLLAARIASNSSYTIWINSRAEHLWERTWRNRHPIYTHSGSEEQSKVEWDCRLATSTLCKHRVIVNHSSCSYMAVITHTMKMIHWLTELLVLQLFIHVSNSFNIISYCKSISHPSFPEYMLIPAQGNMKYINIGRCGRKI